MLTTIRAEIDLSGQVHLLEDVPLNRPRRALVTILDDDTALNPTAENRPGNAAHLAALLRTPLFANRPGYPADDMEAYIEEARNSWE